MLSLFVLLVCLSSYRHSHGHSLSIGGDPNVTHLTPNVSISQRTFLYSSAINLSLEVYQQPVNTTHKKTLQVLSGAIGVNSSGRCIAYGVSFDGWGPYPIQNPAKTGNGGCDALWGEQCSQSVLSDLVRSLGDIEGLTCGVRISDILSKPLEGCPPDKNFNGYLVSGAILQNDSFMLDDSKPPNLLRPWVFIENDPSIDGNYEKLIQGFTFTYFVGRPYGSGEISAAIACMSAFPKTSKPETSTTPSVGSHTIATALSRMSRNTIILSLFLSLLITLFFIHAALMSY